MILYSCWDNLKVAHSKGVAVFNKGRYETSDKDIISELLKDTSILSKKDVDDLAHEIKEKNK